MELVELVCGVSALVLGGIISVKWITECIKTAIYGEED